MTELMKISQMSPRQFVISKFEIIALVPALRKSGLQIMKDARAERTNYEKYISKYGKYSNKYVSQAQAKIKSLDFEEKIKTERAKATRRLVAPNTTRDRRQRNTSGI